MATYAPTADTDFILRISEAPASFFRKGRPYCVSNIKDKVSSSNSSILFSAIPLSKTKDKIKIPTHTMPLNT